MEILKSLIAELDRRLELWEKQQKISFAEFQSIERQDAIATKAVLWVCERFKNLKIK
jgi:hypothetical protein